jgi:tetratricopeptide (TPR) repeat protein
VPLATSNFVTFLEFLLAPPMAYSWPTTANYGMVLRDCSRALELNQKSIKALYRSGVALVALQRYDEALDCCDRLLDIEPTNNPTQTLRIKLLASETAQKAKEAEKVKQEQIKRAERLRMKTALKV